MGRRGSTYEARLEVLVNVCYRLSLEQGYVDPNDLAEELNLSSRMIRNYINDLLTLNVLQYRGENKFAFNLRIADEPSIYDRSSIVPKPILERILNKRSSLAIQEPDEVQTKIEKIFNKMERVLRFPEDLGNKVRQLDLSSVDNKLLHKYRIDSLRGNRLVEPIVDYTIDLDNLIMIGSSATQKMEMLNVNDFALMTISFLASSSVAMVFQKNKRDERETHAITRPQIEKFIGKEPFQRVDPFYDMYYDFPELLMAGRSIASRFLSELLHVQTILDLLNSEWFERRKEDYLVPIIFKKGVLSPHGFIVQGKTLSDLQKRAVKAFYELIEKVRKEKILLAGVSIHPRDDVFFKMSKDLLDTDIGQMNDINFFKQIMANQDVTCLVERTKERGKPKLRSVYEFYTKEKENVAKVEFYSVKDPLHERETILRYLRPTFTIHPTKKMIAGSNVTNQADIYADEKLKTLSRQITHAIQYGFAKVFDESNYNFLADLDQKHVGAE